MVGRQGCDENGIEIQIKGTTPSVEQTSGP